MSRANTSPRCAVCGSRCQNAGDGEHWVCTRVSCGAEWNADHGPEYAMDEDAPVEQRCDRCPRPAVWEAVTNGDHRDVFACGRHLHAALLVVTQDGWAKVGPLGVPDAV